MLTQDKKNILSSAILAQIAAGKTPREALDTVMGAGTFAKIVDEIYPALRARALTEKKEGR